MCTGSIAFIEAAFNQKGKDAQELLVYVKKGTKKNIPNRENMYSIIYLAISHFSNTGHLKLITTSI